MSPVDMSDLSDAGPIVDGNLMLIRQGSTDYKVNVTLVRNINLAALSAIPTPIVSDLFYMQRGTQSYSATFGQIGFAVGVRMWFNNALPPVPNWGLVPNTGNSLCACVDQSGAPYGGYNGQGGGVNTGTWQQTPWTLTIDQIPTHSHTIPLYEATSSQGSFNRVSNTNRTTSGGTANTGTTGGGGPHNHGNTWRPMANTGTIGIKNF